MPHSWFFVQAIPVSVKLLDVQVFSSSKYKRISTGNLLQDKSIKMGQVMASFVEVETTGLVQQLTSHILLVLS